jgi:hypothetical protein
MSLYASPRSNQCLAGLLRPSDDDGINSIRRFEIEFLDSGVEALAFTFG